jgi:hypothetical protein
MGKAQRTQEESVPITAINANNAASHRLALAAQPSGLPEFTVVLNYLTGWPFGLLAYVVKQSNRAAWVGELPLMSEGYVRGGKYTLHTGNTPVEQAFGVTFAGNKRVGEVDGYSTSESRLKVVLDPNHDVRDILLVAVTKKNEYASSHLQTNSSSSLRSRAILTIVDGNNDSTALAENGMRLDRTFGERQRGTWFVPGIIRMDSSGGVIVDTDGTFFGGDESNQTLPYLDRDGNFMRVTAPVNSRR